MTQIQTIPSIFAESLRRYPRSRGRSCNVIVCMYYVCIWCTHVNIYACTCLCYGVWLQLIKMYSCMHVCMYVRTYACDVFISVNELIHNLL
jgi:hypothetical protein